MTRARPAGLAVLAGSLLGCSAPAGPAATAPRVRFTDATSSSGLAAFRQTNGSPEKTTLKDQAGAGLALLDCDDDGDLDVFLVNGASPPGHAGPPPSNALFRNLGGLRFEDATAGSGLESGGHWGQGVAVADVDGDSHLDLYVTNHGPDRLYLGVGGCRFADGTETAGLGRDRDWSTGAAFLDHDRDGDLDLYVAAYVDWDEFERRNPGGTISLWKGFEVPAGPRGLPPQPDRFHLNRGDGTFVDHTAGAGLAVTDHGCGFQPTVTDFDGDGLADIFVANDADGNFLWKNRGDGTFEDVALRAGVRYLESGAAQSCMGAAVEDYDGDGRPDIFVTNFSEDFNTLYRNLGGGFFQNRTAAAGLATESAWKQLGWGTFFFDADNDGDLDLFVVNGHVYPQADRVPRLSYAQPPFLYLNRGDGSFEDRSAISGEALTVPRSARGAAHGDLDGDGDLDIVINNLDTTPTLLRNDSEDVGAALRVRLVGRGRNRSAIGARVALTVAGITRVREVRSSQSFLSAPELTLHFGLGAERRAERLEVRWPAGAVEVMTGVAAGEVTITEGGLPPAPGNPAY